MGCKREVWKLTRSKSCGWLGSHSRQLTRLPERLSGAASAQGASRRSLSKAESDPARPFPFLTLSCCRRASPGLGTLNSETWPSPCATAKIPSLQHWLKSVPLRVILSLDPSQSGQGSSHEKCLMKFSARPLPALHGLGPTGRQDITGGVTAGSYRVSW